MKKGAKIKKKENKRIQENLMASLTIFSIQWSADQKEWKKVNEIKEGSPII